jgi:hemerythrin
MIMSLFAWNESYSVGVKTIDQQHSGLFDIVNELHTAMMKGHAQGVVGPLLDKLVKYTRAHFNYEECMMEAAKYPGLAAHRTHHVDLTRQVEEFMTRYKRGDGTLNIQLLHFLRDWLTEHIQHEDKGYGPWVNGQGVR